MDRKKPRPPRSVHNVVVISDTHCGCRLALCPREGVPLDDGGTYLPSPAQLKLCDWWDEFCNDWVPEVCHGEPFILVHNGDVIDGVHHNSVSQISHNLVDQKRIAKAVLGPLIAKSAAYYHIRGTEAHVGKSAQNEEEVAQELGAVPNREGQHARYDLWLEVGGHRIHCLHHIGTTSSSAYEATAIGKELVEEYVEAARWDERKPDIIVRSHRHRNYEVRIPTASGYGIAVVTPAWQLKSPYTWRIAGARLAPPQIGGVVIRLGDQDFYTRTRVWTIGRTPTVKAEIPNA